MRIHQATEGDLPELARLFSQYRVFYGQSDAYEACRDFLEARFQKGESVIFIAAIDDHFVGFTQLYPSFTSVGMAPIWILNDLFVSNEFRKAGVATALIEAVMQFSRQTGRKKVVLSTAYTNLKAQRLYEKLGFRREEFYNYEF